MNMDPSTTTSWKHLAPNSMSAYKQLFLKGRRIRARDLYGLFMSAEEPMTPEEIAADYGLPLEAVREANHLGGDATTGDSGVVFLRRIE